MSPLGLALLATFFCCDTDSAALACLAFQNAHITSTLEASIFLFVDIPNKAGENMNFGGKEEEEYPLCIYSILRQTE